MISVRGQMPGSPGICPHGDRHFNVKGFGPVSISTDLKAVSVKHRLMYMSTSIECHCCTQSHVVNLCVGKSVRCLDQVGNRIKFAVLIIEVALLKRP